MIRTSCAGMAGDLIGRSSGILPLGVPPPVRAPVVDDHADVRHLIRAIVDGVEVVGEADGADAARAQLGALSAAAPRCWRTAGIQGSGPIAVGAVGRAAGVERPLVVPGSR